MSTREVLEAAKALIADPECWSKGEPDPPHTHCAITATVEASVDLDWPKRGETIELLRRFAGGSTARFNGTHSHAEVMALFDRAIKASS